MLAEYICNYIYFLFIFEYNCISIFLHNTATIKVKALQFHEIYFYLFIFDLCEMFLSLLHLRVFNKHTSREHF